LFDLTAAQLREMNEPVFEFAAEIGALSSQVDDRTRAST